MIGFRKKSDQSRANRILITLISISFILQTLSFVSLIGDSLLILKYGLIVTLPGGLAAQEMAADIQSFVKIFSVIANMSGNVIVSCS